MHTVRHVNCEWNFLENEIRATNVCQDFRIVSARKTEQKYERYYLLNLRQLCGVEQRAQDEITGERELLQSPHTEKREAKTIKFRRLGAEARARERALVAHL